MSSHSQINLMDLEDMVGDRSDEIDARVARKHIDSRDLGVSLFRYQANAKPPFGHSHKEQEEAYVVVSGSGNVMLDGEVKELRQWDVLRVAPEVVRAFSAGPDGLSLVAVGGPRPEEGDGVMTTVEWPS